MRLNKSSCIFLRNSEFSYYRFSKLLLSLVYIKKKKKSTELVSRLSADDSDMNNTSSGVFQVRQIHNE